MTDEEIKALREKLSQSISLRMGKWDRDGLYCGLRHLGKHVETYGRVGYPEVDVNVPDWDDAGLIVDAVNALPGLLDALETARRDLAAERAAHERTRTEVERLRAISQYARHNDKCALVSFLGPFRQRWVSAGRGCTCGLESHVELTNPRVLVAEPRSFFGNGDMEQIESEYGQLDAQTDRDAWKSRAEAAESKLAERDKRIEALHSAFAKFGVWHSLGCGELSDGSNTEQCTCGLDAARKEAGL